MKIRKTLFACLAALLLLGAVVLPLQAQAPSFPAAGAITAGANLRGGPGTSYARLGALPAGAAVTVVECNNSCDWYKLDNGRWVAAFLVRLEAAPAARAAAPAASLPQGVTPALVTEIVDGDTIGVRLNGADYRLRYIGMDTPERDMSFFSEATAANAALVQGQTVYLEKDVSETDRYGRLLRYVYLANGVMVNEALVRQGMAAASTYPPDVKHQGRLAAAQRAAQASGAGFWGAGGDPRAAAQPAAPAAPAAPAPAVTARGDNCDPSYPDVCIPSGPDLDCPQISYRRFRVLPPDPHRFDGDHDGIGCERD